MTRSFLNENPKSQEMQIMATAKQLMLETVDKLNELNLFEKPLRLKSKSLAIIVQTVNAQLAGVDSKVFWGSVTEDIVDVLETNGIELPPEKKNKKNKKKEMSSEEVIPKEFQESAKEKKNNDKEDKKARKAAKKAKLKEIKRLSVIVADKDVPKKERKKAKKQLKKLNKEEEGTNESTCSPKDKTTKSTAGTVKPAPKKGVAARAAREIPEKISWPKEGTITQTIVKFLQKKPRTIKQVENHLEKKFPERPISGMKKTIGAMIGGVGVPLPIHYTKGIPCEVENDGTPEKTVFIPVKE